MGNIYILTGMLFGDEGKGTFVDYLAHKHGIQQIVRYNGGSQASHTVIAPEGTVHKFSQMGSGMFLEDCNTYISSNMVINPANLIEEVAQFSKKTGYDPKEVLGKIIIDEKCYIVTPYHKLMNRLRELSKYSERRGSVGTGVSEVRQLLKVKNIWGEGLGVQMKDLYNRNTLHAKLEDLHYCIWEFYKDNKDIISQNIPDDISEKLEREIYFLTRRESINHVWSDYLQLLQWNKFNVCPEVTSILQAEEGIIFEAAQGLLLDEVYGIKPNTTILDTTIKNAVQMVEVMKGKQAYSLCFQMSLNGAVGVVQETIDSQVVKVGITKAFASRHGPGVFPTEEAEINASICDINQEESFWNGQIRFGWFDAVLMRYAQAINNVDELFLSSIDRLSSFQTIKVCNEYVYTGSVDDEFQTMFEYEQAASVIVCNIKNNQGNISKYLMQCKPVYIELDGWNEDVSRAKSKDEFPVNCLKYISQIEWLTGIKVSVVSVGPTRTGKVVM